MNYFEFTPPADAASRAALIQEWLGDRESVKLIVQTRNDNFDGPSYLRLTIDAPFLERVLRLMAICNAEGATMQTPNMPHDWHDNDGDHVKYSSLEVDRSEFWFKGEPKYGEGNVQSMRLPPLLLAEGLQLPKSSLDEDCVDNFQWFGDHLVYAEEEPPVFIGLLHELMPEVLAAETAAAMSGRIGISDEAEKPSTWKRRPAL